uniref:Uncharacterized protein n=1 Tax=Hemiselmis andersenii TaxID=464988 RepID=A0A7S1H6W9_HEMAN|mmetsp:Transcript_42022/g.102568  ORF Transcript_42022/g.102568 Transcript_42022/m.102568 type:complete len:166 (+) Transcript_42022:199-696(+)
MLEEFPAKRSHPPLDRKENGMVPLHGSSRPTASSSEAARKSGTPAVRGVGVGGVANGGGTPAPSRVSSRIASKGDRKGGTPRFSRVDVEGLAVREAEEGKRKRSDSRMVKSSVAVTPPKAKVAKVAPKGGDSEELKGHDKYCHFCQVQPLTPFPLDCQPYTQKTH